MALHHRATAGAERAQRQFGHRPGASQPPIPPADLDFWAAQGNPGWAYAAVRPYLHKAEANPTPHLARPNLQVFTGAHASRILTQGRRAVGVECMQGGLLKQLRTAGEVRLCAGALQSPQRRMLSGMGDHAQLLANGIATAYHLPGVGLHLHYPVGSCRMGPGGTGEHLDVVDARLRVHGMAGLRVVDASVMPRIVSASTTVATTMLAEKAADMLTEDAAQR